MGSTGGVGGEEDDTCDWTSARTRDRNSLMDRELTDCPAVELEGLDTGGRGDNCELTDCPGEAVVGLDREAGRGGGGIIIGGPGFARVDGLLAVGVTRALEERLVLVFGMLTNEVVDNTIIIIIIIIL